MLVLGTQLINTPIMSLQTGAELARTKAPVIDPHTLSVIAYELEGPLLDEHPSLLRIEDMRELSSIGMIVDSSEEFVGLDDVIKLKEIHDLHFPLIGLTVIDEQKHKIGKVDDYTVEVGSFVIQQLNVKHPLFKSLNDTESLIHRSQVKEITDTTIIVKSATNEEKHSIQHAVKSYVNPFRQPKPQPETASTNND